MTVTTILESLDAEIGRLRQARALLTDMETPTAAPRRGRPKGAGTSKKRSSPKKRTLSPEARERIAAAQRERWSKRKSQD